MAWGEVGGSGVLVWPGVEKALSLVNYEKSVTKTLLVVANHNQKS